MPTTRTLSSSKSFDLPRKQTREFREPSTKRSSPAKQPADVTESFVIVKPPPTTGSNVLQLQIQFISPSSNANNPVASPSSASLATQSSMTSLRSTRSTTSVRRIVPLYNLHTHSMTPNTIHDAGTDEKISRFCKKDLEIINLAKFQPIEIYPGCTLDFEDPVSQTRPPLHHSPASRHSQLIKETVTSSSSSSSSPGTSSGSSARKFFSRLFNFNQKDHKDHKDHKDQQASSSSPSSAPTQPTSPALSPAITRVTDSSTNPVNPESPKSASSPLLSPSNAHPEYTLPSILGTTPLLHSLSVPPQGRPNSYVWISRKWYKTDESGDHNWLSSALNPNHHHHSHSHHGHGHHHHHAHHGHDKHEPCEVDVRFEWTRLDGGELKKRRQRSRQGSSHSLFSSPLARSRPQSLSPLRNEASTPIAVTNNNNNNNNNIHRNSVVSIGGNSLISPSTASSSPTELPDTLETPTGPTGPSSSIPPVPPLPPSLSFPESMPTPTITMTGEIEDESDAEESTESQWTCTLVVYTKSHPRLSSDSRSAESPSTTTTTNKSKPLRLKLASLTTAPYHPKIVAQFKVQYPLPDVDLLAASTSGLITRSQLPGVPGSQPTGKYILCAEEIKDVICSTAIWLVNRERFGGLAKRCR